MAFGNPGERILGLDGESEVTEYEKGRAEFVDLCEGFARWATETQADQLPKFRSDVNEQRRWIRKPDQITEYLLSRNKGRFEGPDWRDALSKFPDVHAIGRWVRIVIWYAMRRLIKPSESSHSFENNWDDAHYAFLASYTKRIATRDKGLIRLVGDLYEGVEIYDG